MLFKRKPPRPPERVNCASCGKELQVRPSRREKSASGLVFCDGACRAHYFAAEQPLNATCHYCGKEFHRSPSELERRNVTFAYCSRECYESARQQDIADKRRPAGRHGAHEVQCANCGTSLFVRPSILSSRKHQFCTVECKRQFQIISGKSVPRE